MINDRLHLKLWNRIGWFVVVLGIACAACQPVASMDLAPTETLPTTTTSGLIAPLESTVTAVKTSSTATPMPTILRKVGELPITGQRLAMSSDGTLIAAINNTSRILSVFDLVQQEVRWQQEKEGYGFTTLAISPDRNLLAAGGVEQQVLIYDMTNGNLVFNLPVPYIKIERVSFSPDSRLLAVSSIESDFVVGVMVWDVKTGQLVDNFPSPNIVTYPPSWEGSHVLESFREWYVGEAIFVPNQGSLLAMTINFYSQAEGAQGVLYFWDLENQELMEAFTDSYGQTIASAPNGLFVVADMGGQQLRAWDVQNHIEIPGANVEAVEIVRIAVTDEGILATLDRKGTTTIWNLKGEFIANLETAKIVEDIAFTPDGHLLVAYFAEDDHMPVEIWQLNE